MTGTENLLDRINRKITKVQDPELFSLFSDILRAVRILEQHASNHTHGTNHFGYWTNSTGTTNFNVQQEKEEEIP